MINNLIIPIIKYCIKKRYGNIEGIDYITYQGLNTVLTSKFFMSISGTYLSSFHSNGRVRIAYSTKNALFVL